jgi:hypothetical protein
MLCEEGQRSAARRGGGERFGAASDRGGRRETWRERQGGLDENVVADAMFTCRHHQPTYLQQSSCSQRRDECTMQHGPQASGRVHRTIIMVGSSQDVAGPIRTPVRLGQGTAEPDMDRGLVKAPKKRGHRSTDHRSGIESSMARRRERTRGSLGRRDGGPRTEHGRRWTTWSSVVLVVVVSDGVPRSARARLSVRQEKA